MSLLRSSFLRHVAQTSPDPDGFEVARGEGIYLYDQEGNAFIDCISGITVSSLGHGHPRIIRAIQKQLDLHLHTHVYGEHITSSQVALAQRLSELLPPSLNCTYFVNSGAEAVEGALKLARRFTGRYDIIACRNAYHGSTAGVDSLRSDQEYTISARPLIPGIHHINFNSLSDLDAINNTTAAVIIEPVQGEAGVIEPSAGYLQAVKKRCEETGSLLILDEIQTGMGRTGTLWAFEKESVIPDILLLAKAFGGGLPLGAFISDHEIMKTFAANPPLGHMTTFGGNPLCCAAGLEALNIILDDHLHARALDHEKILRQNLNDHPFVKEIRGRGLLLAIELTNPELLQTTIKACRKEGFLVDWFLFNNRSIRFAPPLTITGKEINFVCEKLVKAFNSVQ